MRGEQILYNVLLILLCMTAFVPLIRDIYLRRTSRTTLYQDFLLIVVTALEMLSISYLDNQQQRSTIQILLMCVAVGAIIFFNIGIMVLIRRVEKSRNMRRMLKMKEQQAELQENYYKVIHQQYKSSLLLLDNMKERMLTLKSYYDAGDTEEASAYTDSILDCIAKTGMFHGCRDATLAIILEDKRLACKEKGIHLRVKDESSGLGFMDVFDMTVIFSNLLDNAITSCESIQDAVIRVQLMQQGSMLAIGIQNPYDNELQLHNGGFRSTKKDPGHGIGLKNVRSSVEKYGGTLNISTVDGVFDVQILLPMPTEK